MVSIRKRRHLSLVPNRISHLGQPLHTTQSFIPKVESSILYQPVGDYNGQYNPEHEAPAGSFNFMLSQEHEAPVASSAFSGTSSSQGEVKTATQERELKRRKRQRRKHLENQEPCTMRGVYFKNMKWQAAIKVEKKQIHLGTVSSMEEAAHLYDRAAYMCGREPNFELTEEEKRELEGINWDEFLSLTRQAIANKKRQRKIENNALRKRAIPFDPPS